MTTHLRVAEMAEVEAAFFTAAAVPLLGSKIEAMPPAELDAFTRRLQAALDEIVLERLRRSRVRPSVRVITPEPDRLHIAVMWSVN